MIGKYAISAGASSRGSWRHLERGLSFSRVAQAAACTAPDELHGDGENILECH